jgi:hypothetical protein
MEMRDASMRTGQMLVASVFLAFAAMGCGEQKGKATAESGEGEISTTLTQESAPAQVGTAVTASAGGAAETVAPGESLPPDVAATAPDTLVTPGSVVVITALGSADVTSVTLTDGAGEKTPFTFDSETNLWRVSYRVPVRLREDRIGLSVTASTDANRWKRVWLFLQARDAGAKIEEAAAKTEAAAPDSGL